MSVTTSGNGSKPAILVVDDDEIMLASLARMLGGSEHSVEAYATAEEAMERVNEGGVEVVVSDIVMPTLTGLELLRQVREVDPDLPVVLVTGTPAIETAIAAVEVGAFRYLVKPVSPVTLRSVVARAVQVYRLALMKREALSIIGQVRPPRESERHFGLLKVESINGQDLEEAAQRTTFETLTPIFPETRFDLEIDHDSLAPRLINLVTPIGRGQRGLIVSPPKAGKTTILKQIANSISTKYPDVHLIIALIGERPEEVTDMDRSVDAEVVASTFDEPVTSHVRTAEIGRAHV